jgi:hypothetical protein
VPAFPRLGLLRLFPERASVGLTDTLGLAGTEDSLPTRDLGSLITAGLTVYAAGTRLDAGRTHATSGQDLPRSGKDDVAVGQKVVFVQHLI